MTSSTKCSQCDYEPHAPGANWGFLNGPKWWDYCKHVIGERWCDSCSQKWYRDGNDSTHDYEVVGDPAEYSGGCSHEDCPGCVAALAIETAGTRTFAAAVDMLMPGAGR